MGLVDIAMNEGGIRFQIWINELLMMFLFILLRIRGLLRPLHSFKC